ncbi:WW domain-containing oxidoreductase [Exidia glandulosa HHB12029]|uniref:WW domain-containing oxidoreductase n=1 Tax=Exidia glandulosa HHB12029 TaxID=1314781 RepID=A0A165JCK6_EXIGL|nr:WW domain-containing oxidoreductase [Exidia glandulosa HHB12029]
MSQTFGASTTAEEVVSTFADRVKGRVFLVTGPTPGGTGDATVRALATGSPAALLLVGRSPAKFTPTVDFIRSTNPSIVVKVYTVDLGSIAAVRAGAQKILEENERVDVIINSAGIMGGPLRLTGDGIEQCFAVAHLGHFLLTNLLLPALRKSDEPRVVNLTSAGHANGTGDYSDINFKNKDYAWEASYAQAKLANVHFSKCLAARGITSYSIHPGVIWGTSLAHELSAEDKTKLAGFVKQYNLLVKTASQGASTSMVAALDPTFAKDAPGAQNGSFMMDCAVAPPLCEAANNKEMAEALWKVSEELVGQKFTV